jgi:C4-dicarboxylate-specific signal transduction histidine kinase
LQEAMASGLISLGARVAGINDQLREFSEFQFDSFNSIELQEKMQMVFNLSQAERDEIGLKMRRKMEKDYSLDAEIVKVEQMLINLTK